MTCSVGCKNKLIPVCESNYLHAAWSIVFSEREIRHDLRKEQEREDMNALVYSTCVRTNPSSLQIQTTKLSWNFMNNVSSRRKSCCSHQTL